MPHRQLVVLCGLSGSGKTSLALDTLYAEGQRRYIDSFSAYTRQFLERLEKPAAERIDGIPPAIAVTHKNTSRSSRSTVGTATETSDYLRLLFAKIGQVFCTGCGQEVRRDTPPERGRAARRAARGHAVSRRLCRRAGRGRARRAVARLSGRRASCGRSSAIGWSTWPPSPGRKATPPADAKIFAVVDRLAAGSDQPAAAARFAGDGLCQGPRHGATCSWSDLARRGQRRVGRRDMRLAAGRQRLPARRRDVAAVGLQRRAGLRRVRHRAIPTRAAAVQLQQPAGRLPGLRGLRQLIDIDMDLVVPDPNKSLSEGAIAPWNTPAYAHELQGAARAGRRL